MGNVLDFVDRQTINKVTQLMKECSDAMKEFTIYVRQHGYPHADDVTIEGGKVIYRKFLDRSKEAAELAKTLKGDYHFANKFISISRSGPKGVPCFEEKV